MKAVAPLQWMSSHVFLSCTVKQCSSYSDESDETLVVHRFSLKGWTVGTTYWNPAIPFTNGIVVFFFFFQKAKDILKTVLNAGHSWKKKKKTWYHFFVLKALTESEHGTVETTERIIEMHICSSVVNHLNRDGNPTRLEVYVKAPKCDIYANLTCMFCYLNKTFSHVHLDMMI